MSIRLRLALLVAVLGLGLAVPTLYWFHVAGQMRKGLDDFAARQRAEGRVVATGTPAMGGFPLSVAMEVPAVSLVTPDGWAWAADGLTARLDLLAPDRITIDAPGIHRLRAPGWSGLLAAGRLTAVLGLDGQGRLGRVDLDGARLSLEQPGVEALGLDGLSLGLGLLHPAEFGHKAAWAALSLTLTGLGLSGVADLPFDHHVARASVDLRVMGTPPAPSLPALAAWSAEGGTIELDRFHIDWAPMAIEGEGTLALDPALQPLLAATVRARGAADLITRLVRAGHVEPAMAEALKVMMALLARPDAEGRPPLRLPLALQDGILSAGQVRVAHVPPLPFSPPGALPQ